MLMLVRPFLSLVLPTASFGVNGANARAGFCTAARCVCWCPGKVGWLGRTCSKNHWRRSWDLEVGRALVNIAANGTISAGPDRKLKMADVIDPADETEILTPGPDLVKAWGARQLLELAAAAGWHVQGVMVPGPGGFQVWEACI